MTSGRRCCIARLMRNNPFRAAYRELSDAQSQTSWPSTNVVGATIRREEYVPGRHWTLRIDLFNEFFKGLRFPLNISSRADANRNFGRPKFPTPTSPEHPNFARPKFSRIHIPASHRPQAPKLLLLPVLRTRLWMSKEPMGPSGQTYYGEFLLALSGLDSSNGSRRGVCIAMCRRLHTKSP